MKKIIILIGGVIAIGLLTYLQFGATSDSVTAAGFAATLFALWLFRPELKKLIGKKNKKSQVWYDGLDDRHYHIEREGKSVAVHYSDGTVKFYHGATFWDKIRIHFL